MSDNQGCSILAAQSIRVMTTYGASLWKYQIPDCKPDLKLSLRMSNHSLINLVVLTALRSSTQITSHAT